MKTFHEFITESPELITNIVIDIQRSIDTFQHIHWNVKDVNFDVLHTLSGKIYDSLLVWQDKFAERAKALDPGFEVTKITTSINVDASSALTSMLDELSRLDRAAEMSYKNLDEITQNLVLEFREELQKNIWQLTNSKV